MSGHSKWSTIKRQKGATDKARGQIFTKLGNSITIAVKEGGGVADPSGNIRLRLAIDKAKQANMPKENIQRAIDRATGKLGGGMLEEVVYEGFGPEGVAILAEGVTDNKQRTAAVVKNVFSNHGGSLGGTGSVAYLFVKTGVVEVAKTAQLPVNFIDLVIESGADNYEETDDVWYIYTKPADLHTVKDFFSEKNIPISEAELSFKPTTVIEASDSSTAKKVVELLEALEELEDIHKVHANMNFENLS